jgi:hypothetical protein
MLKPGINLWHVGGAIATRGTSIRKPSVRECVPMLGLARLGWLLTTDNSTF